MKIVLLFFIFLSIFISGCQKAKPQLKLCTVTIPEPSKEELNKFNGENFGKK